MSSSNTNTAKICWKNEVFTLVQLEFHPFLRYPKIGFRISDLSLLTRTTGKCGGYFQGPSWRLSCPDTVAWCIQGVFYIQFFWTKTVLKSPQVFVTIIQFSDKIMWRVYFKSLLLFFIPGRERWDFSILASSIFIFHLLCWDLLCLVMKRLKTWKDKALHANWKIQLKSHHNFLRVFQHLYGIFLAYWL